MRRQRTSSRRFSVVAVYFICEVGKYGLARDATEVLASAMTNALDDAPCAGEGHPFAPETGACIV